MAAKEIYMPWVAAAATVGSSLIGGASSRKAAAEQEAAAQAGIDFQNFQFNENLKRQEPFRQAGLEANDRLRSLLSEGGDLSRRFNATDLANDPVYNSGLQFGLDQGAGAINSRALGMGQYDSGATLKALTKYGNDYGSTKANESYNRFNTDMSNLYNRNAGMSGAGQTATNQVQAAGTNAANQISDLNTQSGNARAAGIVGEGNAWNDAAGAGAKGYQNYQSNKQLQAWLNGGSSGNGYDSSQYTPYEG
jgi:hypothetical protein